MQIGEGIKNLLGNMVLGKRKFKKTLNPKPQIHGSSLENELNRF
jgi:hypothetical protein